jgi:hypothetical protein
MNTELLLRTINIFNQPHQLAAELLKNGWYPVRLIGRVEKASNESIDQYMERLLTSRFYTQIKENYCYAQYPEREHILREAFYLFEKEKYIACIPLFLSQIDGIAKDFGTNGFFSGKTNNNEKIQEKFMFHISKSIGTDTSESKYMMEFFYSLIFIGSESFNNFTILKKTHQTKPDENNFLNRHGIMHGNKEYLAYGTRPNALRSINLLLFLINLITDLKNDSLF